jgi:DNA-binding Lrp family transcriptional regulator
MPTVELLTELYDANCRPPYRTIGSTVGIRTNAVKTRVKKLVAKGIIQKFIVMANPAIFGYEKQALSSQMVTQNLIFNRS